MFKTFDKSDLEKWGRTLDAHEIEEVKTIIYSNKPGDYELPQMYGAEWAFVIRRQRLGRRFKGSVLRGDFERVTWIGRRSNKHQLYRLT